MGDTGVYAQRLTALRTYAQRFNPATQCSGDVGGQQPIAARGVCSNTSLFGASGTGRGRILLDELLYTFNVIVNYLIRFSSINKVRPSFFFLEHRWCVRFKRQNPDFVSGSHASAVTAYVLALWFEVANYENSWYKWPIWFIFDPVWWMWNGNVRR